MNGTTAQWRADEAGMEAIAALDLALERLRSTARDMLLTRAMLVAENRRRAGMAG